ncbi:MAG: hypothetical protein Q8R18_01800 [bacterium]|nr:hypothetical protein [bacterium]
MRQESILCFSLLFVLLGASLFVLFSYEETFTGLVGANVSFGIVSSNSSTTSTSAGASTGSSGSSASSSDGGKKEDTDEEEDIKAAPEYIGERENTFFVEGGINIFGESFSDLHVGDTLYFGSFQDNRTPLPFLVIDSFDAEEKMVDFTFNSFLAGGSQHTLSLGEKLLLDFEKDGLDEYILTFQEAGSSSVTFSFKRIAQISFALFGAPVIIPIVLHTWLVIIALILFFIILFILVWWARKIF